MRDRFTHEDARPTETVHVLIISSTLLHESMRGNAVDGDNDKDNRHYQTSP